MRKFLSLIFVLSWLVTVQTNAQSTGSDKEFLFQETFANINGSEENLESIDASKLDNNRGGGGGLSMMSMQVTTAS